MVYATTFSEDVYSFFEENRMLTYCTAGIAVGIYTVGNLCGRAVSWILECCQSSAQVDQVGREEIKRGAASPIPIPVPNLYPLHLPESSAPYNNHEANKATLQALQKVLFMDTRLPLRMIGEEHIAACLYAKLIDQDNRRYIEIVLPLPEGRIVPADYISDSSTRLFFIPMSVNHNTHNTMVVIDKQNQTYRYFDSLNRYANLSEKDMAILIDQGLMKTGFEVDEEMNHLQQNDGWSCGYFALEHAMQYLDRHPRRGLTGTQLREKYAPFFDVFITKHGTQRDAHNLDRVNRRQKTRLRDAIDELIQAKGLKHELLEPLSGKLIDELFYESPTRMNLLSDFASRYFTEIEDDPIATKVLGQCEIANSNLNRILSREIDMLVRGEEVRLEEQETNAFEREQLEAIKSEILQLLADCE